MAEHTLSPEDLARSVHGALELERVGAGLAPLRLPSSTRPQHADAGIGRMSAQGSGVRLRLRTRARRIRLDGRFTRTGSAAHPPRPFRLVAEAAAADASVPESAVESVVELAEGDVLREQSDRTDRREPGADSVVEFDLGEARDERMVTLWLPHSAATVLHRVSGDAPLAAAPLEAPRWVHYGSSISHGSDLADPRDPWPVRVAADLGLDLVNLGFAGNAMLDAFVARAIAGTAADLVTLKIGINIVNGDAMRARTFVPAVHAFLDLVREGHPCIPIGVITALACPAHEDATGPTRAGPAGAAATPRPIPAGDGSLTLRRTRALVAGAVAARRDPALHLVDGPGLLGVHDGHLPDGLHPDREGHALVAARAAPIVRGLLPATG